MKCEELSLDRSVQAPGLGRVVETIGGGGVLAYPAETMYGLGGDGLDRELFDRIARIKVERRGKPFLLLLDEQERWRQVASSFPPVAERLALRHWPGPLTLLLPALPGSPAAGEGGGKLVAVRVPEPPHLRGWVAASDRPLISTSANRSGDEPARTPDRLRELFQDRVELLITGPLFSDGAPPSTIVDTTTDPPSIVRPGALPLEGEWWKE